MLSENEMRYRNRNLSIDVTVVIFISNGMADAVLYRAAHTHIFPVSIHTRFDAPIE